MVHWIASPPHLLSSHAADFCSPCGTRVLVKSRAQRDRALRGLARSVRKGIAVRPRTRRSGVAGAWRIRHKLMLGLGLVVAIMGLLLAGTVKGILSYRASMRTIGNKVDELVESDNLQVAIKSLGHTIVDSLKPAREMNGRIKTAREALDKYRVKLEESVANSRSGIDGSEERERAQDIERRLDKLAQAIQDVTPQVLGPGASGGATLIERPAVKEILTVLVGAASDLNNVISKYLDGSIERWRKDAKTNMIVVVSTTILSILLLT